MLRMFMALLVVAMPLSAAEKQRRSNRLIHERSPYLFQHASNPVGWYPWGKEALRKAKAENKPIFLSIGYSTCHWCQTMEAESFSDPEIGALMNSSFVSVLVDREERPFLDRVYMALARSPPTRRNSGHHPRSPR